MIKGPQIQQLQAEKEHVFHYITAITKTQVEALLKRGVIQISLFDETVAEVLEGRCVMSCVAIPNGRKRSRPGGSRN